MMNLKLVERQSHWRVGVIALFAKLIGVLIHVEGIPFGSNRTQKHKTAKSMGANQGDVASPGASS